MAEIWSDFGFCGVVFESLVVDAIVFLGFVVNLWVSIDHRFWVFWMLLFSGFVNLYGSPLVFLHLLVFFFFFQWWWLGWIWVFWVEMEECEMEECEFVG